MVTYTFSFIVKNNLLVNNKDLAYSLTKYGNMWTITFKQKSKNFSLKKQFRNKSNFEKGVIQFEQKGLNKNVHSLIPQILN